MTVDDSAGMDATEARKAFFYPSGVARMACPGDNDGYPTCLGDNSMCGYSAVLGEQICKYLRETREHD